MSAEKKRLISSLFWNLTLLTAGSVIFSIGVNGIIIPQGFVTGGISGVCLLIYYVTGVLSTGIWYLIVNVPLFLMGWFFVSRRFFFYSLYGMVVLSICMDTISFPIEIKDPFLAILAGGTILGVGGGITLHSLGSLGGLDIIGILLNQKFGIRIGTFFFIFNMTLFVFSFGNLETDLVLYSIALSFVTSQVLDFILTMFNQRKMIIIISNYSDQIAKIITEELQRGATFLNGIGAYSGDEKKIILTVVHNYQLKRLEEAVVTIDPQAFMITENTFNVLGRGFSKPKVY
ncbi:MAG: YitT family protein [Desulfamplus sp.]|nr:YitT family protein [Desulfamplus sp.]